MTIVFISPVHAYCIPYIVCCGRQAAGGSALLPQLSAATRDVARTLLPAALLRYAITNRLTHMPSTTLAFAILRHLHAMRVDNRRA